jgi:phage protein D
VAEEHRLAQVLISLQGKPLPTPLYDLLTLVRVEESVQLPDAFLLRFHDPNFELFDQMTFPIGAKIAISFGNEGEMVRVTQGEVTALSIEQESAGPHQLVVSGMDVAHRLALGPKTRTFQQMTDADIARQITAEYGLEADIDATPEVHAYVLQASQSDYAFLKQRAGHIGFDVWVADNRLFFKSQPRASVAPPALRWGSNLHRFKVRFSSSERCDEVTVRGWNPDAKEAIVGRATEGDAGTSAPAAGQLLGAARSAFGEAKRFAGQFPVQTQGEADALARALMLKASGEAVIARGEAAGDPLIAAGATVHVGGVGEKLAGSYRVTSTEHLYGAGIPYVTRFVCGGKDPGALADLVANGAGAAESSRGWEGLVVGVVTNNADTGALGRVRVKFPSLSDGHESTWARLVSPGAGNGRGLLCIPEVNDEVLLGFEQGDKRRPLVLGGLWNKLDPPPPPAKGEAVRDGKVVERLWTSRKGHRIAVSDDDEGFVEVRFGGEKEASFLRITKEGVDLHGQEKAGVSSREITLKAEGKLILEAKAIQIKGDIVEVSGHPIRLN